MEQVTNRIENCVSVAGVTQPGTRLLDRLTNRMRLKHYSIRTEEAYRYWVRRFTVFHGKRHMSFPRNFVCQG